MQEGDKVRINDIFETDEFIVIHSDEHESGKVWIRLYEDGYPAEDFIRYAWDLVLV